MQEQNDQLKNQGHPIDQFVITEAADNSPHMGLQLLERKTQIVATIQKTIPWNLEQLVQSELLAGERIVWIAMPIRSKFILNAGAIGPAFLGLFWTALNAYLFIQRIQDGSDLTGILSGLLFLLVGIFMLIAPLWRFLESKNTVYVLTNNRVIIAYGGGFRVDPSDEGVSFGRKEPSTRSWDLERITNLKIDELGGGAGDLSFKIRLSRHSQSSDHALEETLHAVPEVKEVKKTLYSLSQSAQRAEGAGFLSEFEKP